MVCGCPSELRLADPLKGPLSKFVHHPYTGFALIESFDTYTLQIPTFKGRIPNFGPNFPAQIKYSAAETAFEVLDLALIKKSHLVLFCIMTLVRASFLDHSHGCVKDYSLFSLHVTFTLTCLFSLNQALS